MALSPISKIYAVQDLQISQLIADYAPGTAPSAPSTPSAPTVTGGSGGSSWGYKVVTSNGTDSAQSSAGTDTTGASTLAGLASDPLTVTLAAPVPSGQVAKVLRSTVPDGSATGLVATLKAGDTVFVDTGVAAVTYTANPDGVGVLLNPKIDIPGIQMVDISGSVKTATLRGDFQFLDSNSILEDLKVKFAFAKANLEALAVMSGGSVAYAGSTPNRTATWTLSKTTPTDTTNRFKYFQLEAQSVAADPLLGDVHFRLPKCILSSMPSLGMAEEDYQKFDAEAMAIPRLADGAWMVIPINETLTQIGQNR